MTLRELTWMADERGHADRVEFEAYRMTGLVSLAHTLATIINFAPFRNSSPVSAKEIFDQLSGVDTSEEKISEVQAIIAERRANQNGGKQAIN